MKIHNVEDLPTPARVRVALAERGAADRVEFIPVDVMRGEHRREAHRLKNSDPAVPCLALDDGAHISQYIDGLAFADLAKAGIPGSLTHHHAWRARVAARPTLAA